MDKDRDWKRGSLEREGEKEIGKEEGGGSKRRSATIIVQESGPWQLNI